MTFPEFLSWQAYARRKAEAQAAPAKPAAPDWDNMPTLGALSPGEISNVITGR
jgi:hypothetical protein